MAASNADWFTPIWTISAPRCFQAPVPAASAFSPSRSAADVPAPALQSVYVFRRFQPSLPTVSQLSDHSFATGFSGQRSTANAISRRSRIPCNNSSGYNVCHCRMNYGIMDLRVDGDGTLYLKTAIRNKGGRGPPCTARRRTKGGLEEGEDQ